MDWKTLSVDLLPVYNYNSLDEKTNWDARLQSDQSYKHHSFTKICQPEPFVSLIFVSSSPSALP